MKRFCVCKVIGDGLSPDTAFRAAISDVVDPETGFQAFHTSVVIATHPLGHPQAGQPVHPWCLVHAAGKNFKLLDGNADIDLLPEFALDVRVGAMHAPTMAGMGQKLQARGINTSFVGAADGFRDVIRGLGKLHDPAFDEKNFDVAE